MGLENKGSVHISVIIPAHNEENYILKTLNSLKDQDYQNFETIVVDSASTDRTQHIVSHYMKQNPKQNISLISEEVKGVSKARNKGAKFAKGNLLVFLDADTTLDSACLSKVNEYMKSEHAIATCHSKPEPWTIPFSFLVGFKNAYHRLKIIKGVHGSLICWQGHFEKVEGFDENLEVMEHHDIIKKLLEHGKYLWIPTAFTTTSMRRWQRKGIVNNLNYWISVGLKKLKNEEIKKEYEAIR